MKVLRWAGWSLLFLVAAVLLVLAAWVASNIGDAPAVPRPAALTPPPATLAQERNAFFVLQGLTAPMSEDPGAIGRQEWAEQGRLAAMPHPERMAEMKRVADEPQPANRLARPNTAPWPQCASSNVPVPAGGPEPAPEDCTARWLAEPELVRTQRTAAADMGARCEAVVDAGFEYEEALPVMHGSATQFGTLYNQFFCSRWLRSSVVLAFAARDAEGLKRELARADRLHRGLLQGSSSLIANVITLRIGRHWLATISELATRDPALAAPLESLVAGWPAQEQQARRWMAVESAYGHATVLESSTLCGRDDVTLAMRDPPPDRWDRLSMALSDWPCRTGIGYHPQRTVQAMNAQWLQAQAALDQGWSKAIEQSRPAGGSIWHWHNTAGMAVVEISRGAFVSYLARQADFELYRYAVQLQLAALREQVPAAERAAWLARQPLAQTEVAKDRLSFEDNGMLLTARLWQATYVPGMLDPRRDAVRIRWPG